MSLQQQVASSSNFNAALLSFFSSIKSYKNWNCTQCHSLFTNIDSIPFFHPRIPSEFAFYTCSEFVVVIYQRVGLIGVTQAPWKVNYINLSHCPENGMAVCTKFIVLSILLVFSHLLFFFPFSNVSLKNRQWAFISEN